jgi:hypothetical protein
VTDHTYQAIHLGHHAPLDPTEGTGNHLSENAEALVGATFGSPETPLHLSRVLVTFSDLNNNGIISEDGGAGEPISYDLGAGRVTSLLDSTVTYSLRITYGPDRLDPVTVSVGILQDEAGNLFLLAPADYTSVSQALAAAPIQSITILSVVNADFSGIRVPRQSIDFLCFGPGTRIDTPLGPVPVEQLCAGMMVRTLDHGAQPLRLLASSRTRAEGSMAPVVIAKGALGNRRELILSPQHRVLLQGTAAELLFGEPELLVPAVALVGTPGVTRREGGTIDYYHLVFDRHEIVFAEGVAAESLLVGEGSLARMPAALRREVLALFPGIAGWQDTRNLSARPCLTVREARVLLAA